MRHGHPEGTAIYLVAMWAFAIFLTAADCELLYSLIPFPLTMLLNCSGHDPAGVCNVESIQMDHLYPLLHLCATGYSFFCQSRYLHQSQYLPLRYVSSLTASQTGISHMSPCLLLPFSLVTVVQVLDIAFCNVLIDPPVQLVLGITTLRFLLAVILLMLAVIPTLKELVVLYRATKQWQPNQYMQQLVTDGVLYFIVYVSLFPFLSVPLHSPAHVTLGYLPKKITKTDHYELLGT